MPSTPFNSHAFIEMALSRGVLKFGEFTLKSGRISPYFFNAGLLNDSEALALVAQGYAEKLNNLADVELIFGPAYKGIPFVAATATQLWNQYNKKVDWGFNRKEAKTHGEGGMLVGAPVKGKKIWILDDVITAGTAIREVSDQLIQSGANISGIIVALDRQEKGTSQLSAIQELQQQLDVEIHSLINMNDLIDYLQQKNQRDALEKMRNYRELYGV